MASELIVMVFIALALVFIVHKMLQEAFDLLHIGVSIFGILIAILFLAVAFDAVTFRMNLGKSENLVVFHDGGKVMSADLVKEGSSAALDSSQLQNLSALIAKKDYKQALGSNYKLILIANSLKDAGPEEILGRISNPAAVISDLKSGDIYVYPETVTFKILRYVPNPEFLGFFKANIQKIWVSKNET